MVLGRPKIRTFIIHLSLWILLYGLFLLPFLFQFRLIPPDLPLRLTFVVVLFYINYYLLVPRILLKRHTAYYIIACLAIVLGIGLVINLSFDFGPRVPTRFIEDHGRGPDFPMRQIFTMLNLSAPIFVSGLLRLYMEWRKNEGLRVQVENEKVHSELQVLKTQLNPHFLFNSLNAIYSLSVKNSSITSEAIITLSELMRYMLYEADKDKVPLGKEMDYIKNYVRLQRLRLSDSVNVKLRMSGDEKGKELPPLLFISFIENAFKYGTDFKGKTHVEINLQIEQESIVFKVRNRIGAHRAEQGSSGVGLENIKNRLNLLYPNRHTLDIVNDGQNYEVTLILDLWTKE
jgi:sensor histidine kinase YesM